MFHYIHLEGVGLNENLLTEKPAGRWLRRIEATKAQFVHRNVNTSRLLFVIEKGATVKPT